MVAFPHWNLLREDAFVVREVLLFFPFFWANFLLIILIEVVVVIFIILLVVVPGWLVAATARRRRAIRSRRIPTRRWMTTNFVTTRSSRKAKDIAGVVKVLAVAEMIRGGPEGNPPFGQYDRRWWIRGARKQPRPWC